MAESRREKQQREAKEAYASVWKSPERKSPVTDEGERSEIVGPAQLASSLNVRVTHPVFEMVRAALRRDGFTHPEQGQFIMLPREFEALLALENKAVVQVVFLILRETIGWTDEDGRHKRREWVQLGRSILRLPVDRNLKDSMGKDSDSEGVYPSTTLQEYVRVFHPMERVRRSNNFSHLAYVTLLNLTHSPC